MDLKIGTHDSITGEKGLWWCLPLIPFSRTQSKTLLQQYEAGARLFDIRAKYIQGKWRGAHGWWFTKRGLEDILRDLVKKATEDGETVRILLTYEGKAKNSGKFLEWTKELRKNIGSGNVTFGPICSKYSEESGGLRVDYAVLEAGEKDWIDGGTRQAFLPLDGTNWQTYLPIPWLWKNIYFRTPKFNESTYQFVDFL